MSSVIACRCPPESVPIDASSRPSSRMPSDSQRLAIPHARRAIQSESQAAAPSAQLGHPQILGDGHRRDTSP